MLLGISFLSALAWTVQLNGMRDALRFLQVHSAADASDGNSEPDFQPQGAYGAFYLKRNPVTLESVAYGAASGVMLGSVLLIFHASIA